MKNKVSIYIFFISLIISFTGCISKTDKAESQSVPDPTPANLTYPASALFANGNKIVNENGDEVRLIGVNICGLEWNSRAYNVIDSTYEAFANWNCNVVRLPLAQDRWFGKVQDWSTPKPPDGGHQYREIVEEVVRIAELFGKYIIIDLHWSNAGVWGEYVGQHSMPDENSLEFWLDVAGIYGDNPSVLFNLYNEPRDISWEVWRNGGEITEVFKKGEPDQATLTYTTPGHQKMVEEIRATGANNIIIAGGIDWAYDLTGIRNGYALTDTQSGNGIVYDSHIYPWKEWDGNNHNTKVFRTAQEYPVMIGEIGIDPAGDWGAAKYPLWLGNILNQIDRNALHWIGWCFHTEATPSMLDDWEYTPTKHLGVPMKERFFSYADTNSHLEKIPDLP